MPRPPKQLSKKDLEEVEALASIGLTQELIADAKGICVETLMKYASEAYRRGKAKGIAKVCKTAYEMAVSGKDGAMTRFYLRTQAGWIATPAIPPEIIKLLSVIANEEEKP